VEGAAHAGGVGRGAAAEPEGKREKRAAAEQDKVAVVLLGVAGVAVAGFQHYCLLYAAAVLLQWKGKLLLAPLRLLLHC
jgi:hypothetical protein